MQFEVQTKGHYDFIDITREVKEIVKKSKIKDGLALVFVSGATAAITTLEYEKGVIEDLKKVFEKIAPEQADYQHHNKWGDHNGAAHVKSALLKTDLSVPIEDSQLVLGDWQQIVLIDFDERPRIRKIFVRVMEI